MPGTVQAFDTAKQTATIQLNVTEYLAPANSLTNPTSAPVPQTLPILSDVPVVFPRAGGFVLTFPVKAGDECLVIFADMDYSAWWQSGGTQNQIDKRRHDLSDGFAIVGIWNQTRVVQSYSASAAQLRSDDGQTVVEVGSGEVTITANTVTVNAAQTAQVNAQTATVKATGTATVQGNSVDITGSSSVTIGSSTTIDNRLFMAHTHGNGNGGAPTTGVI